MNAYRLADLSVGMTSAFGVTVTAEMMARFLAISGDSNPLHTDVEFARSAGYSGCVVYGMLTASFYSTLAGVYLPGLHALLQGVDVLFAAPVFVDDALTIRGEISAVHRELAHVELRAQITNERGEKVSRAKLRVGVRA